MSRIASGAPCLFLSRAEWLEAWRTRAGLIPVAVDRQSMRIQWCNLGGYHFYESFFHKSLDMFEALTQGAERPVETELDVLLADDLEAAAVPLAGLIFHAGRCRSTLLARAIARSRENLVLSEPQAISTLLQIIADPAARIGDLAVPLFRNLVLAMSRRRLDTHRRVFIKFSSHNVAAVGLIRAAFPMSPALFLSRDPEAIVASFHRSPPGWVSSYGDVATQVRRNLDHAAAADLPHVDHDDVTVGNLAGILGHFSYAPSPDELARMQYQFGFDSKADFWQSIFMEKS